MDSQFIAQKSEQWHRLRLGKFTSGHVYLFMGERGVLNDASKKFMSGKLMELLTGEWREIKAKTLEWGNNWEPFAKQQIANKYNSEYFDAGYIQNPYKSYHGGSPDGIITINGIQTTPEIKCPVWEEALTNRRLLKSVEQCKKGYPELYWQCMSNMVLQETAQALAVSFHHQLPQELQLSELIIPFNIGEAKKMLDNMAEAYKWFESEAKELGIDIDAKYAEYATPLDKPGQSLDIPESHFTAAA